MTAFHRSSRWAKFARKVRPVIQASLPAPCVNAFVWAGCRGVVHPDQKWDVAHRVSHHRDPFAPLSIEMVGPGHTKCNRIAGGKEGRQKQLARGRPNPRLPHEGSGW